MTAFALLLETVQKAGEDFEWYPTTDKMIAVVARNIPKDAKSIMDIGAGDGRVLTALARRCEHEPLLYAIEKSEVLIQALPANVIPVGTDLFEQNLACLPVDFIFCNPPYSHFALWASTIIDSAYAQRAYLVIPQRWKDSAEIADALKRRNAMTRVIHSDDFAAADRPARAVVDIVEVSFQCNTSRSWNDSPEDPFDIWFDLNVDTFHAEESEDYSARHARENQELTRVRELNSIRELVDAYNEEYERMQENYRAIFRLDFALLKELGVNKNAVRDGIKVKMANLKTKYWTLLFERLDVITSRLSTATKKKFLEKLTKRAAVAFTQSNAYSIIIWAIKNANQYFDEQVTHLFRELSTFDGVANYKSNQRTWEKHGWRYQASEHDHYALDYRIVVERRHAIWQEDQFGFGRHDYPGNLYTGCHELLDDIRAVLRNLGFESIASLSRDVSWSSGTWVNWYEHGHGKGEILFQAKAFKNGNIHFRFAPDAIKALNVEAGRLLGWLQNPSDVETELGYTRAEAKRFYGSMQLITPSSVRLLAEAPSE